MRAVALDYEARRLAAIEVPEPEPSGPGEVLLRVHLAGVCGTDRELAQFRYGYPPAGCARMILGHEALAQVVESGEWVVPMIRRACSPPCASCARGRRDLCLTPGYLERGIFGAHGYFSDWAVDHTADLVRVPPELADRAVLVEPMSVVEKALARAFHSHPGEPATALVLGAGPIGVLAALALGLRGLRVALASLEPRGHPRARFIERAGIPYFPLPHRVPPPADIVIEAAGVPAAALAAAQSLNPLGVAVLLGAPEMPAGLALGGFIDGNRALLGSVNAAPQSFVQAVEDLCRLDPQLLEALLHRAPFGDFAASLLGPAGQAVKVVHVVSG